MDGGPCQRAAQAARNGRGTDEPDDGDRDDDEKERDHVTHLHTFSKPDRWSFWKGPVTQMGDVASSCRPVAFHGARRRVLRYGDVIRPLPTRAHP